MGNRDVNIRRNIYLKSFMLRKTEDFLCTNFRTDLFKFSQLNALNLQKFRNRITLAHRKSSRSSNKLVKLPKQHFTLKQSPVVLKTSHFALKNSTAYLKNSTAYLKNRSVPRRAKCSLFNLLNLVF